MDDDNCPVVDLLDEEEGDIVGASRGSGANDADADDFTDLTGDNDKLGGSSSFAAAAAKAVAMPASSRVVSRAASGIDSASRRGRLDPEEKVRRAADRAAARLAKQREKEAAKALAKQAKNATVIAERAARGGLAKVEIGVSLESTLAASEEGLAIEKGIAEGRDEGGRNAFAVLPPTLTDITNGIFWRRRKLNAAAVDPTRLKRQGSGASAAAAAGSSSAGGAGSASRGGPAALVESDFLDAEGTLEPFFVLFWRGATYVDTLLARGTDVIEEAVAAIRARLPAGTRILFLVQGASEYISRCLVRATDPASRRGAGAGAAAGGAGLPAITRGGYDAANAHLYVKCDIQLRDTNNIGETVVFLQDYTRAVAEFPYHMQPSALAVITKKHSIRAVSKQVAADGLDKDAVRLAEVSHTWLSVLAVMPGMSEKRAKNVVARFPTMRSLVDAYRNPAITTAQKERLLERILGEGEARASKQTALSIRFFRFLTTYNPDELIGSGT